MNTKCTPGAAQRGRRVDAADRGAGERAAHEARVQHPGQRDVVDVGAVPGEQAGVLDAVDARADVPGGAGGCGVGHAIFAAQPPSTGMIAPLTNDARSDARNARDLRDLVRLPAAVAARAFSSDAGTSTRACAPMISVWMKPGQMAVHADALARRTRRAPVLVTEITPAFAARVHAS